MKTFFSAIILFVFFMFYGCTKENTLTKKISYADNYKLEEIEELIFNSSDTMFVGQIRSIKIIDNNIFISDDSQCKVHIFDKNFRYLKSFGKYGRGPGEFPKAPYLYKFKDTLIVNRRHTRTLCFYKNGENVKEVSLPEKYILNKFDFLILKDRFVIPANNRILRDLTRGIENYTTLLLTDNKGKVIRRFAPLSDEYKKFSDNLYYARGNFSKVTKGFNNTLASIQIATNNIDIYDYDGNYLSSYKYKPKHYITPPYISSKKVFRSGKEAVEKFYSKKTYLSNILYDEKLDMLFIHYRRLHVNIYRTKSFLDADNYLLAINNKWKCIFDAKIDGYLADIEDGKIYIVKEESGERVVLSKCKLRLKDGK